MRTTLEASCAAFDHYLDATERVADDPDAPVPAEYRPGLRDFALQGAAIGFKHAAPTMISVDAAFLRSIHS